MTSSAAVLYSSLGADPDLAELVEAFVSEMPDRIRNLLAQFDEGNHDELRRLVHHLKGAAGSYGFHAVTPIAARLEFSLSVDRPEEQIERELDDLVSLCRGVRAGAPA